MYYHITESNNIQSIFEKGLIPSIGERSILLNEKEKCVYLFGSIELAEDAFCNWLSEYIEEDCILLAVDTAAVFNGSEFTTENRIPPEKISIVKEL